MNCRLCSKKKQFDVKGPFGGLSTTLSLPDGFNCDTDRCDLVILMHGFMASQRKQPIVYLSKFLVKEGYAALSFDFNSHGRSEGRFEDMTLSSEIADARAVYEYARAFPFVDKIAFLGHSQGAVVAGMLAGLLEKEGSSRPFCLVQLAPAAVLKDDALNGRCMNARYDPNDPPEYVKVLFQKNLGRSFIKEAQQMPIYETSALYKGKVCLIHGNRDGIVPLSYSERYDGVYGDSMLHVIKGLGHFFFCHRREVRRTVGDFLAAAKASLSQ